MDIHELTTGGWSNSGRIYDDGRPQKSITHQYLEFTPKGDTMNFRTFLEE